MTREEAKAYIIRHCNPDYPDGKTEWETAMNMAISALQQPEIVRCKECKHHHYEYKLGGIPYCDKFDYGYGWRDDDFCSYAERREE